MGDPRAAEVGLDKTMAGPATVPGGRSQVGTTSAFVRSTVLPAARPAPAAGERFAPVEHLGAGGMGEVVLVDDRDIERQVAIKRLRPDQRSEPALQRFAEEVRIIGQLEHPNITPVHDVGVDESGQHYFVMKYIKGDTLEAIIRKLKGGDPALLARFGFEERIELFLAILHAIEYAHSNGVIHRDLKPSNIMVGPFGEVTVMDWGLARRKDTPETAPRGTLLGTPLYMSPEQAAGDNDRVDERSDVFALSVLFYELMTLEHPLAGKQSVAEIIAELVADGIDVNAKVRFLTAGAPCEYGGYIQRGLAKDPAQRFGSVREMIEGLHKARAGKFAVTCHITLSKRACEEASRFIDRHPTLYTVMLSAGVAGVGWTIWRAVAHLL